MEKESSTNGLEPKKLARLLNIGTDTGQDPSTENIEIQKQDLIRDRLSDILPLDPVVLNSLPILLKHLYKELLPLAGVTIGRLLLNPKTDISIINKIKEYSKAMVSSAESEVEEDTAVTLYYTAIASALIYHETKVTKYSYVELGQSFSSLNEKPWMLPDLKLLFNKACEVCRGKIN